MARCMSGAVVLALREQCERDVELDREMLFKEELEGGFHDSSRHGRDDEVSLT